MLQLPGVQRRVANLLLELPVVLKPFFREGAVFDGFPHGAPRFRLVRTVPISAPGSEVVDVLEGLGKVSGIQVELPHPRRVDDQTSVGEEQELAVGGGVAPPAVVLADLPGGQHVFSQHPVDQRGFPHPRGPDEGHGFPHLDAGSHDLVSPLLHAGTDQHLGAHAHSGDVGEPGRQIGTQVRLGQNDDGGGPTSPGDGKIALQAAKIEIGGKRHAEKDHVDVGRHHLGGVGRPCGLALEDALAAEHVVDSGVPRGPLQLVHHHPVPWGGKVRAGRGLVGELAGDLSKNFPLFTDGLIQIPVLLGDPRQEQIFIQRSLLLEARGQTVFLQRFVRHAFLHRRGTPCGCPAFSP